MAEHKIIKKKANTYFFTKILINIFLIILGAVLIGVFLRQMQSQAALKKQEENSQRALEEAISILETNQEDVDELTRIFHDGNQDTVKDLYELMTSGLFDSLGEADTQTRSEVLADVVERSGADYLFLMDTDGKIVMSPYVEMYRRDLVTQGLLTYKNAQLLIRGTENEDGTITPAMEKNSYGYFYFYSVPCTFNDVKYVFVLGTEASVLDVQIESLKDVSVVLSRAPVSNDGFMFAVNTEDNSFIYYENGDEVLTGQNALENGLSEEALTDGYTGTQMINGRRYHCVSRQFGNSTVICAVAATDIILANDRYVLFWSIAVFVLVMIMCLAYAVIVRNDFVRNAVETEKVYFGKNKENPLIFDKSVFRKVFPLMLAGVFLIFGITYYTQTLLEISQGIDNSKLALDEVTSRYEESLVNRKVIQDYYNNLFLSKARLISYLIEEDPSVLNEETARFHSVYDENGDRVFLLDDEGNHLRSVSGSARLQELCDANDIDSVYIFDEDGRTIATNTPNWFFTISHDPEAQSYEFLQVLDGRKDTLIQDAMTSDVGEDSQFVGVIFNYYTSVNENGETVYRSHFDYEADETGTIHKHRSLLQIGMNTELSERLLASTDVRSVLSSDMLYGGFIVLFSAEEGNPCVYSPVEASIGKTAAELGVSPKAFSGLDYYGFTRVNGVQYFQYFRYTSGYYIGTAIPRSNMYQTRTIVSLITSLVSLFMILFLSGTVTFTTKEEEYLYETMSDTVSGNGLDSAIFSIILPSGHRASTVKAAARWDNRHISWSERSPEQKLQVMLSVVGGILIAYVLVAVFGVNRFFSDNSIIHYILSGDWDRGVNVFAFSACSLVMIFTAVGIALFRIPVRVITQLLGARGETIGHLTLSIVKYGGSLGALFYCLYLAGMDSFNLLASAGVLSLVIGLGAQSLIKDILAGIFIVFEGEFRVGDIVTISGFRGTVMDIGLRTTKIMAADGNIKIFNNSEISGVLNMTKETSVAAATIAIEYGQDIDYVEEVLNRELPLLAEKNDAIIDGPTYLGVSELGDSGISLIVIARCSEQNVRGVNRFLNKELLQIFYRNGINVPFPNVTVSHLDTAGRKTMADLPKEPEKEETPEPEKPQEPEKSPEPEVLPELEVMPESEEIAESEEGKENK